MIELLLEMRKRYPNDQEFGRKMSQLLNEKDFLELENTLVTDTTTGMGYYIFPEGNKHNHLINGLRKKYLK